MFMIFCKHTQTYPLLPKTMNSKPQETYIAKLDTGWKKIMRCIPNRPVNGFVCIGSKVIISFYNHMRLSVSHFQRVMPLIKVAVVGGGAAGLCALRHLTARPSVFTAVGFEQTDRVGGTWVYTDDVGTDQFGLPIHSSMYKNLRTNLPKEVMAFPDLPFDKELSSFIRHEDVLAYLETYAKTFDLYKFIKFRTSVDKVKPIPGNPVKWEVTYSKVIKKKSQAENTSPAEKTSPAENTSPMDTEVFDAVMVCNGHYSIPMFPEIPRADSFEGNILHSHDYRDPEHFRDQRVVCLGAGSSGQDIALELSRTAKEVILSHNKSFLQSPLPENMRQAPGIKKLLKHSVVFNDDSQVDDVDMVLCCTGYHFSFPFLTEECKLNIEDERLTPLYKHLIHTQFTSLSFIGVCKIICPFPHFHCQVLFALAVLDGSLKLPSKQEMDDETEADFRARLKDDLLPRYAHHMGPRQWNYNNELATIAGFTPIAPVVENLYSAVHISRGQNLVGYKKERYELTGHETFKTL